ncbi:MAG: cytochrome c peroxidase [Planctomycetota bacterium]|nr:hypothetical protein [Planctomycetota bacterium]MEE3054646.1 cytochrome c peroxidase [Planctomycetota bacterium]
MKATAHFFSSASVLLAAAVFTMPCPSNAEDGPRKEPSLRRPIALAVCGGLLVCANRDSGSISLIDLDRLEVSSEQKIGLRLGDLESSGANVLVTDSAAGRLLCLSLKDEKLVPTVSIALGGSPQDLAISASKKKCAVASPWRRQVTIADLTSEGRLMSRQTKVIELPFSPGRQVFCREDTLLVVADAFGGRLALIDPQAARLRGIRRVEGHGIRGLAPSGDGKSLLLSHQRIESRAPTTRNRVFWGQVISNIFRSISFEHLLEESAGSLEETRAVAHWSLYPFGTPGKAAGDPGAVAVGPRGTTLVALGGVDRIALRSRPGQVFEELEVGDRPVAVALGPMERYGYVANFFGDSISVVDIAAAEVVRTISLGPGRKLTPAERGEKLFFDAKLSLDGWYSCHSCHLDGHTHGELNDNLGDETYGTPKRVPTLLGTSNTGPWGWLGNRTTLWEQVEKSIETTMRGKKPEAKVVEALVAYLELFDASPPVIPTGNKAALGRGQAVFERLKCGKCHRPPTYTSVGTYDVGLKDETGQGSYNPPSLNGLQHRGRFLHDNSAATLSRALELHRPAAMKNLRGAERADLLKFLLSI